MAGHLIVDTFSQEELYKLYSDLVETSQDLIWQCDAEGKFLYLNPAWEKTLGYHLDEMLGNSFPNFQSPEVAQRDLKEFSRILQGGTVKGYETTYLHKSGKEIHLVFNAKIVRDNMGVVTGTRGTAYDITDRKEAEKALRKSEMQYRSLFQNLNSSFSLYEVVLDENGDPCDYKILAVNPMYEKTVGVKATDVVGKTLLEAYPQTETAWLETMHSTVLSGTPFSIENYAREVDKWIEITVYVPEKGQLAMIATDVTDRKRVEKELRESEDRFNLFLENSPIYVFFKDENIRSLRLSRNYEKMLGMPLDHLIGKNMDDLFPSDLAKKMIQDDKNIIYNGKTIETIEELNGRIYTTTKFPVKREGQKPFLAGFTIDITETTLAERALAEEKERLAVTLRSIGDAVITTNSEGTVTMLNKAAEMLINCPPSEAIGLPLADVFDVRDTKNGENNLTAIEEMIMAGKITETAKHTYLIKTEGGEIITSYSGAAIQDKERESIGAVHVFRDITEEKNAQKERETLSEQLHQSQKMDAIGKLAGGIAHDFNNSLSGIIGATELLLSYQNDEETRKKYLNLILSAATNAGDLAQKLLLFSRKGNKVNAILDMTSIITDLLDLLDHTINKNISISINNRAKNTTITGDSSLLQNALMNIAINASHVMPEGGEIEFSLDNRMITSNECKKSPFDIEPGEYLNVSIRDTGWGMSEETQSHIFEPFYTTKERGKGTGLGLATVYGTVQDHHGSITVTSEVGKGTLFQILLPLTNASPNGVEEKETISGSGTILLIDDEELIRVSASALLEMLGYNVIIAVDGQDGLQKYQENTIDLVIVDMIMPIMGGRETITKLREIDAQLPIIVCSGFASDSDIVSLQSQNISGYIHKPFRKDELAKIVSQALKKQ